MARSKVRLYVEIIDHENDSRERVVLVADEDNEYVKQTLLHDKIPCLKMLIDEGYCVTEYFYPIPRYSIGEISIYYE